MVIVLVETAKGIENVDAIAAVEGVDVVWLGHYDLNEFHGHPGAVRQSEISYGCR